MGKSQLFALQVVTQDLQQPTHVQLRIYLALLSFEKVVILEMKTNRKILKSGIHELEPVDPE